MYFYNVILICKSFNYIIFMIENEKFILKNKISFFKSWLGCTKMIDHNIEFTTQFLDVSVVYIFVINRIKICAFYVLYLS